MTKPDSISHSSDLANQFSAIFREEHRAVRDALLDLIDAFRKGAPVLVRELLGRIAALTGPHFRYEEESMYPALVRIFGREYVMKLFEAHNGAIGSAKRLVSLAGQDSWNDEEVDEAVGLVRDILPHVSDCDGLSIMVERLPDDEIQDIFETRERCNEAGLDLLQWAKEVRQPPMV